MANWAYSNCFNTFKKLNLIFFKIILHILASPWKKLEIDREIQIHKN